MEDQGGVFKDGSEQNERNDVQSGNMPEASTSADSLGELDASSNVGQKDLSNYGPEANPAPQPLPPSDSGAVALEQPTVSNQVYAPEHTGDGMVSIPQQHDTQR